MEIINAVSSDSFHGRRQQVVAYITWHMMADPFASDDNETAITEKHDALCRTDDAVVGDSIRNSVRWKDEESHDDESLLTNPSSSMRSPLSSIRSNISLSRHSNPGLLEYLIRNRKQRNPHDYFDVIEVLGVGSMGSVSKVKKKDSAVGGSARSDYVDSEHSGLEPCFNVPLIGSFVQVCAGIIQERKKKNLLQRENEEPTSELRKQYKHKQSSFITYISKDIHYALKSINLNCLRDETYLTELRNEIEILKSLDHPNIVRPIETFEHRKQIYMLMELCSGGDLYTRDPYSQREAAAIIKSILSAVAYMHDLKICHRDLKYENIVFATSSPDSEIKIIDFGLSRTYDKAHMHDTVGTVYTMAPEVIKNDYTNKADMWSIGVISFMLLSSTMPFYGKRRTHVIEKILKCKYSFKGHAWKNISMDAKHFVWSLLQMQPSLRSTAVEASQHKWLANFDDEQDGHDTKLMDAVQATLESFGEYSTLKKLALMVVAHQSTSEEIGFLRQIFEKYDSLKNGIISLAEFTEALIPYGYSNQEIEKMFQGMDLDGTGVIHYTEFLAATIEAHGNITEERLAEAFDRLDCDDSGYITSENLRDFLGERIPQDYLEQIIDEADLKRDHRISYDEFLELWDEQYTNNRKARVLEVEYRRLAHSSSNVTSESGGRSRNSSEDALSELSETSDEGQKVTASSCFRNQKAKSVRVFDM